METNEEIAEELNRKGFIRLDNGLLEEAVKAFSTKELVKELKTRIGVESFFLNPDNSYDLELWFDPRDDKINIGDSGPAIILIITD